ncbi:MAG: hypothetical protein ACK5MA_01630 [Parachlamydiaceae bacterium]
MIDHIMRRHGHHAQAAPAEKNDKVKQIAIKVLKALGIILLGATFGALTLASAGTVALGIGIALGAVTALVTYLGTKAFIHEKRRQAFPAFSHRKHPPIEPEKFTHQKFEKGLKMASELPAFDEWKNVHPDFSERKIKHYFWKKVRDRQEEGQAYALQDAASLQPGQKGGKLLKNISEKQVFYHQILEEIGKELNQDLHVEPVTTLAFRPRKLYRRLQTYTGPGIIRLEGKKQDALIFFEVQPNGGIFYDPYSKEAGMHDKFAIKEEFLRTFDKHVQCALTGKRIFRKQYERAQVNTYSKINEIE